MLTLIVLIPIAWLLLIGAGAVIDRPRLRAERARARSLPQPRRQRGDK